MWKNSGGRDGVQATFCWPVGFGFEGVTIFIRTMFWFDGLLSLT